MSFEMILPWCLLALASLLGFGLDRLALARRADGERGDFWSRGFAFGLYPLGLALWLSQLAPIFGVSLGWTLLLDQVGGERQFFIALALPFLLWLAVLAVVAALKPDPKFRWLVGGVGFANSRRWLLCCALPLLLVMAFNAGGLGGGQGSYPAALWSVLGVAVLNLAGLAFSAGRDKTAEAAPADGPARQARPDLRPWPEVLAEGGIQAKPLWTWPAGGPGRAINGGEVQAMAERLKAVGATAIAPELLEGVAALLRRDPPGDDYGAVRLVFAPDGCGQAEIVGLAATLLDRQFHTVSLVVVPSGAEELAAQLCRWLPDGDGAVALGYGEIPESAVVWVADAEFLSDRLLARLKNPRLASRIGLVVWWQLQDYTGVMAANLWAIARRLHRLLRFQGRHDIRTLGLLRTASPDAQWGDFVRRLLPHARPPETHVENRLARPVQAYLLAARESPARQFLLMRAAAASVAGGWPTHLAAPDYVSAREQAQFRQAPCEGKPIAERLAPDAMAADARLLHLRDAELLALPALLGQGGAEGPPIQLGLQPLANPYGAYLLAGLAKGQVLPGSRRLVCAESCPAIIRRHLLLALNELPDTRRGLLGNALWDEAVVGATLGELAEASQLTRREVRYLDGNDRLVGEFEYQSLRMPAGGYSPLDTVGLRLIEVRDGDKLALRVDPERLLIAAYPRRVFISRGQRYRIRDWPSVAEVMARGWLACQQEDECWQSWRIHTASVFGIRPLPGEIEVAIGRPGILTRLAVELKYQEEVTGMIDWTADPARLALAEPKLSYFVSPHLNTFKTRALALRLPAAADLPLAIPSLCQALRYVLPVHLGVEEDALEVVGLDGAEINGEESFGIAIVDLYPGGIGLTDAIRDDSALLLNLLEWTRDWLEACDDLDLQTPQALATNPDQPPQRLAALRLLERIL